MPGQIKIVTRFLDHERREVVCYEGPKGSGFSYELGEGEVEFSLWTLDRHKVKWTKDQEEALMWFLEGKLKDAAT